MSNYSILIVEDTDDLRELLHIMLEQRGYNVIEAADGSQAVQEATEKRPDLILMDLNLPVLSGLDAVRQIRRVRGTSSVPIIAVSALDSRSGRPDAIVAGCNEYLRKPIDQGKLDDLLTTYLHKPSVA